MTGGPLAKEPHQAGGSVCPRVSFVVPCYNLAHLLPECLNSILAQDFEDLEIIVLDDRSPDNCEDVVRGFDDPRVVHVRNEVNLGHLANYNKGISMARGEFIWLISADDLLANPTILRRYVEVMDKNPSCGFVFSPATGFRDGVEDGPIEWAYNGSYDGVFPGGAFLERLLVKNLVCAPTGMVRANQYRIERFPLDLPYAGDWYLWCLFALHSDVAYLSEPMVYYRLHEQSFTSGFLTEKISAGVRDEIAVRWRILRRAEEVGNQEIARSCRVRIAEDYGRRLSRWQDDGTLPGMSTQAVEASIEGYSDGQSERTDMTARTFSALGDARYAAGDRKGAAQAYRAALEIVPTQKVTRAKLALLMLGPVGRAVRGVPRRRARLLQRATSSTTSARTSIVRN